jgi:nitrate/nitrite-specific signal transduction histidine kinase
MRLGILKGSLHTKIITWSFVPTALILAAVAWVTFAAYQQVTEDLVIERNRELTRFSAGEFAARLTSYTGLLTEYAGLLAGLPRSAYAHDTDLVVQGEIVERARSRFAVFDGGVVVLTNQGIVVVAEPDRPMIMRQNWSDRPYFRHMLRSPEPVFSNLVADGPGGSNVVVVAVPIKGDQGQFLGIMAGMFPLNGAASSPFYREVAQLDVGQGGSAYLVDGLGRVIYHSEPRRIGEDFSPHPVVQRVRGGQVGALRTRGLDGREIVASYAPVPGTSWGLVVEEGWDELIAPSRGYQRFLLVLLLLGVVVPALVVAVGVRRITKPIAELIDAAQEVAGGDFGQRITAQTGDEVEELADQFNRMAAQLQESYAHLERNLATRTEELATLNSIAAIVSQFQDLDEVLYDALDKTLQMMKVEGGGIYLLDQETGRLSIAAHRGFSPEFVAGIDELEIGEGFSGRAAQSGQPVVVRDVLADQRLTRAVAREEGFRSLASVPLSSRGEILGTLFAVTHGYREFSDQDVQLLTTIGHQVGIAAQSARLFGEVDQRMRELEALYRADERMLRHIELDQVLQALVDVAVDVLHADKSAVLVWDEGRDRWVIRVARGFSPESVRVLAFAREEGLTGYVVSSGEPAIVGDSLADLRRSNESAAVVRAVDAEGIRSLMHLPIKVDKEVFGVFNVSFVDTRDFGENEQRLFLALVQRAALAIENAQYHEKTQELAVMEERNRLARDLHDAVTQTLFSASLIAEILPDLWKSDPEEGRELLLELRQLSRGALAEMRSLLLELRPAALLDSRLGDLLRQLAEAVTGREGVPVQVTVEGECALTPDEHVALYRIAQEALNNVVKHAQATHVTVTLRCASPSGSADGRGAGELCISDDGCGFDASIVPPDRLGLGIIRERAQAIGASLEIDTEPQCGTLVRVTWGGEGER